MDGTVRTGADRCGQVRTGADRCEQDRKPAWRGAPSSFHIYIIWGENGRKMEKNGEKCRKQLTRIADNDGGQTQQGSTGVIHREHTHCAKRGILGSRSFSPHMVYM